MQNIIARMPEFADAETQVAPKAKWPRQHMDFFECKGLK